MNDTEKTENPPAPPVAEAAPPAVETTPVAVEPSTAEAAPEVAAVASAPAAPPPPPAPVGTKLKDLDRGLDREVEAAMGGMSNRDLYGDLSARQGAGPPRPRGVGGERRKGKVLRVHGPDVFVEVPGGRGQGVLPLQQFPEGTPTVGAEVDVHIQGYDEANGLLRLVRRGSAVHADWSSVTVGLTVEARVTGTNKGGLSVEVNGIRGFMPISQIDLVRIDEPEQFVSQKLRCLVTEVNPAERNLVVSRRALLDKEREEGREKLWQELKPGEVRTATVRSVKEFGAFLDLGGIDGLLHISEMSWQRVADARSVVQPGQSIQVKVLKVDRDNRKVSLGLKQLQASPWDQVVEKYRVGTLVTGMVTRLMDFGAFVELEPGVEGLIHISELSPMRVRRVGDIVQPRQVVQAVVLTVDPDQRRISLSLKAALPTETPEEPEAPVPDKPTRERTTPLRGGIGGE